MKKGVQSPEEQKLIDKKCKKQKRRGLAITGTGSVAIAAGGVALMLLGGPVGIIAGGIVLGAGVTGGISSVQQGLTKKQKKFSYKRWGISAGIGAAGGAIAGPIAATGAHLATSGIVASTGARIGLSIGTDVVAGVAAGTGTKMIANKVQGRPIGRGVLTAALVSGITGGISGTIGATAGIGIRNISSGVGRVAIHTIGGSVTSGSSGAIGMVLMNLAKYGKIKRKDFFAIMKMNQIPDKTSEQIWKVLIQHMYIKRQRFTKKCDRGIKFPPQLKQFEPLVNSLYKISKNIKKGVLTTVVASAAIGGAVQAGVASTKLYMFDGKMIGHCPQRRAYVQEEQDNTMKLSQIKQEEAIPSGTFVELEQVLEGKKNYKEIEEIKEQINEEEDDSDSETETKASPASLKRSIVLVIEETKEPNENINKKTQDQSISSNQNKKKKKGFLKFFTVSRKSRLSKNKRQLRQHTLNLLELEDVDPAQLQAQ